MNTKVRKEGNEGKANMGGGGYLRNMCHAQATHIRGFKCLASKGFYEGSKFLSASERVPKAPARRRL